MSAATGGLGVDEAAVGLAVSEAVANVVLHAYPEREGHVWVDVDRVGVRVVVSVRDEGVGAGGFAASRHRGLGMGLRLIRAHADDVQVEPGGGGTLVVMEFSAAAEQPGRDSPI